MCLFMTSNMYYYKYFDNIVIKPLICLRYPMAVSSTPVDSSNVNFDDVGINPFHAYSILDVKQIGSERYILILTTIT